MTAEPASTSGSVIAISRKLQAFGTQDQYTIQYLSEALGAETIMVESTSSGTSSTKGTSTSAHARPLLMPDEIRRMSADQVIVLQQGQPPYRLQRLDYLHDRESAGLAGANPMYAAVQQS
jgi:type IV secretion system protein VirD4